MIYPSFIQWQLNEDDFGSISNALSSNAIHVIEQGNPPKRTQELRLVIFMIIGHNWSRLLVVSRDE